MKGLHSNTYLTRSMLYRLYKKKLTSQEIEDKVFSGELIKYQAYYKPSPGLLYKLGLIPKEMKIEDFNRLAKQTAFVLKDIANIFGNCHQDACKIIADKYFIKKHNYWYKGEILIDLLSEGEEYVEL